MKTLPRAFTVLAIVAASCAAVASLVTLAWAGAFPDPPGEAVNAGLAEARGWSAVTLVVALPLLGVGLYRATAQRSLRGLVVVLGGLAYLAYTYLEMAVSPPFSALYLVYIAAFACALPALVMGAWSLEPAALARAFSAHAPRRSIAAFAILVAAGLTLAWGKGIAERTLAGEFGFPAGTAAIGHVVHALDLGLQVPLAIAAAALLLRKSAWGYAVAGIMLVNGVCMGFALVAMVAVGALAAGQSVFAAAPFVVLPVASLVLGALFFRTSGTAASTDEKRGAELSFTLKFRPR